MEATQTDLDNEMRILEEEIAERRTRLTELNRSVSQIIDDYTLLTSGDTPVRLSELFGDKDDLILIHNMGSRCSYCTLWADGFNGVYQHLANRAAFVLVSPDPPEKQKEFAESRGWKFPLYSDSEIKFSTDMGFTYEKDGTRYWSPGASTFKRNGDGTIARVARDFFGPGDPYSGLWHLFDLLADRANGWNPSLKY